LLEAHASHTTHVRRYEGQFRIENIAEEGLFRCGREDERRLPGRLGRKPFVVATFLAFACFPLAVVAAHSLAGLALAFVVGGLREIGEPARKALILEFVHPEIRARGVGLYYLIRSLAIAPAATLGGLLWKVDPGVPFLLAGAIGLVGTAIFVLTVEERHAG